jgi:hypothetical protein
MYESPSKLNPALIGGAVIGILTTIPGINCLCCMWIIFGGGLAAYIYWRKLPVDIEFNTGEGALIGLLAGIFGALFSTLIHYLFLALIGFDSGHENFDSWISSNEDIPVEIEEFIRSFFEEQSSSTFFTIIYIFFSLIINSIFGTLGGIIGANLFSKKKKSENHMNNTIS